MRAFWLLFAVTVAVVAGCADTAGSRSAAQSSASPVVAPPVSNPKDARGVAPCSLLTIPQASALEVEPSRAKAGSTADLVDCAWPSVLPQISSVAVTVDTNPTRRGLTDTYLKRADFRIFEPLVVDGYPAVRAERVPSDGCTIEVGLSDTQELRVDVGARAPTDSCGLAKRVIAAVLTNLPPLR